MSPLAIYTRRNRVLDAEFFRELVTKEGIVAWILGLPLHCSGEKSQKSEEARKFGENLRSETGIPVEYFDERFSSRMATQRLDQGAFSAAAKKRRLDSVAAQIILEGYLESNRGVQKDVNRLSSLEDA